MPTSIVANQPLHYLDEGQGFPVVLAHCYLWHSGMWRPQIDALSQHYRVIAPDLWGHGHSGPLPPATTGLQAVAGNMLQLLDNLGIGSFSLVGHSIGALWGTELTLLVPDRVKTLVIMDACLGVEPAGSRARYWSLLDQIEAAGKFPEPLLEAIVPLFFNPYDDVTSPLRTEMHDALASMPAERVLQSIVPLGRMMFSRKDAGERLRLLNRKRTLFLTGVADIPRPPTDLQELADKLGCPFVSIPNAGHLCTLENPDFVNQALLEFLAPPRANYLHFIQRLIHA